MNETELNEKFLEYEALKIEAKAIEEKLDTLKDEIKDYVKEDEKINCKFGVLEMKKRDNWKYTPTTIQMAIDLKEKQQEEVAKGEAISTPIYYLYYKQKEHVEE